jgi:hypothetical protein
MPQSGNGTLYGTGGGGWGGSGGANNNSGSTLGTYYNYTPYGTGGGGIYDANDGPASGGGGSHGYGMQTTSNTTYNTAMTLQDASSPYRSIYPNKGGGGDYFGFITGGYPGSSGTPFSVAAQSQGFVPESYFDIVNLSLKGIGGYGMYGPNQSGASIIAGNGGPGSGGGGVYMSASNGYGGSGGTGGGGGGVYNSSSGHIGGNGGFGGGGGGGRTGPAVSIAFGGKGGPGGGGGGASSTDGGSGNGIGGQGGVGCVMVFWKA